MHAGRRNRLAICYMGSRADKVRNRPRTVFLSYCAGWTSLTNCTVILTCVFTLLLYTAKQFFYSWHTVQFPSCYQTKSLWDSSETCGQLTNAVSNCRCQLHYQLPVAQVLAPKICKLAIFVFVLVFDEAAGTCEKFGLIWRSQMLCGLPVSAINLPARSEQVKRAHVYIPGLLELALVCVIETVGYICICCSLTLTLGNALTL